MQGIEFETDQSSQVAYTSVTSKRPSFFTKIFTRFGVEDTNTVNLTLLGVLALFLGLTIFLYAGALSNSTPVSEEAAAVARAMKEAGISR
jgi:hypothetical protein